jgi:hypothetical protein
MKKAATVPICICVIRRPISPHHGKKRKCEHSAPECQMKCIRYETCIPISTTTTSTIKHSSSRAHRRNPFQFTRYYRTKKSSQSQKDTIITINQPPPIAIKNTQTRNFPPFLAQTHLNLAKTKHAKSLRDYIRR